jgi:uncharacterized protein (TIGR02246 family)
MTAHAAADARAVLALLQAAVDARDPDALVAMFDDPAVLIGTSGDTRDGAGLRRYLTEVATQPQSLRWDWQEVVPFHDEAESLGFAAFGDVVVADARGEERAPIRATLFAVRSAKGWRIRQFHGSIPSDF